MAGRRVLLAGLLVCAAAGACGKKGDPLPPLRPVPARITDFEVVRSADRIELRFTVPAVNADDTTPVAIGRVDVYALRAEADAPPVPAGQIAGDDDNLLTSLPVRPPDDPAAPNASTTVSALVPRPGERATYVERGVTDEPGMVVSYVVVPVAGTGRGRPGPPSAAAHVSLAPLPPSGLEATWDANDLRLSWTAGDTEALRYRVLRQDASGQWQVVTPEPVAEPPFVLPVAFGARTCLAVRPLRVTGNVTAEGPLSAPACVTPVDTYPPPAPESLQLVQEGAAVTIIWSPVEAPDLAGYVVLRGEAGGPLEPLFGTPTTATTHRDTAVAAGVSYTYAVRAVDASPAANQSELSPGESITVR